MQKRMFRDRFNLTNLVLFGQKTQTRDVIKLQDERLDYLRGWNLDGGFAEFGRAGEAPLALYPKYYVGEMVAVAMSYKSIYERVAKTWEYAEEYKREHENLAGWNNKMFTNTKMPFAQIKITKIRFERLQDISDEDCLAEGIEYDSAEGLSLYWVPLSIEGISWKKYKALNYEVSRHECDGKPGIYFWDNPRQAFAALIDKINGKGTWESNPYVWAYDFELAK